RACRGRCGEAGRGRQQQRGNGERARPQALDRVPERDMGHRSRPKEVPGWAAERSEEPPEGRWVVVCPCRHIPGFFFVPRKRGHADGAAGTAPALATDRNSTRLSSLTIPTSRS